MKNTSIIVSKKTNETNKTNEKGFMCSVSGKKYEMEVYNIVKKCKLNGKDFNTQTEVELGGCSSKNDIECNMNTSRDMCCFRLIV